MPVRKIVWTGQGVKVYDPAPADTEICELFSGRSGVAARIIKVTRQVTTQPGGKKQGVITREEITFNKKAGKLQVEKRTQRRQEVRDRGRAT